MWLISWIAKEVPYLKSPSLEGMFLIYLTNIVFKLPIMTHSMCVALDWSKDGDVLAAIQDATGSFFGN